MFRLKTYSLLLVAVLWQLHVAAQLTVSNTKTPTELVEDVLLGEGVIVTNISYTGDILARGEFDGLNSNIGFDAGVLLTSGSVFLAPGPNNSGSRGRNNGEPGDADINAIIAPVNSRDAAVLEFDFRPIADTLFFNYVFASEEYPEYAPPNSSSFNDAFAFLLTGPNPSGGNYTDQNIALIPNTTTPVSINNVNAVTNNTYYVSNGNGNFGSPQFFDNTVVQYDAFTTPLTATAAVVPCATYHIKLVVADAFDFIYDSGVFLEANSFGSKVDNPKIDFASTAPACDGDSVDFLSSGTTGPGILYTWDFGNNASPANSTLQNPKNIMYSTPGLKVVRHDINVNCGDTTLTIYKGVTIDEDPQPAFTSNAPQCENQPINFTYTGTSQSGWTYSWDFGNGASPQNATGQNPTGVLYSSPGTKTVTLTVSNGNCQETITQNITINDRPDANFSNTSPIGIGSPVSFTNSGTSGVTYGWNFGIGSSPGTSTAENPSGITYSTEGNKIIEQIVSSSGCSDTAYGSIEVLTTPNPSFTSNAPQPAGFPITFSYSGNTNTNFTFSWDFGAGASPATSNAQNPPSVFYNTPGTKTITLTVTNGPITIVFTQTIVIDAPPVSSFSSTAPNCLGVGIDFMQTGTSGATYNWDFGTDATPSTSTSANPSGIIYSSAGFKTVRLITTLSGNSDTSYSTIYILSQPQADFTHNAPQCEGSEVTFTYLGNVQSSWDYSWDFGTGANPNISNVANPGGVNYQSAGQKTITLTASNAYCTDVDTQRITINASPVADISLPMNACSNDSVNIVNNGTSGATYQWTFGSGASPLTSSSENNLVTYSSPGIKTIQKIVTLSGCSDTAETNITIIERPNPSFTSNAPQCQGDIVEMTYTGTNNTGWVYNWDFGQGATPSVSAAVEPEVLYSSAGQKKISLTVSNSFCSETDSQIVVINPRPVAGIMTPGPSCEGDSLSFSHSGSSATNYNWDFGAGASPATSTDENPAGITYNSYGLKTIREVVEIGACRDTAYHTVQVLERPNPSITLSSSRICQNSEINVTYGGNQKPGWTYTWDFDAGSNPYTSKAINPGLIDYSQAGLKNISLTVRNQFCAASVSDTVRVDTTPTASFTHTGPVCTGDTLLLSPEKVNYPGINLNWTLDTAAFFDSASYKTVYTNAGIEHIRLIVGINNCFDTTSNTVVVNQTPEVSFSSSAPVCDGEKVDLFNTGASGNRWTYTWDFGTGAVPSVSTAENPMGVKFNGGMNQVSLRIGDANCFNTDTTMIEIYELPGAEAGVDTILCANRCVNLGTSSQSGQSYSWFPESGLDDAKTANPLACPAAEFTQYILTVTDDSTSCIASDTVLLTMLPSAFSDAGADVEVCFGEEIQIGAAEIKGQQYRWEPQDGLSSAESPSPMASPEVTTEYTLFSSYQGCEEISDKVLVTVRKVTANAGEDQTIARGESVQLTASGGVDYEWSPSDYLSSTLIADPTSKPDESITYVVTVTDVFNCVDSDSMTISVVEPDLFIPTGFTPNGSGKNDIFRVRGTELSQFEMSVFDRSGALVYYSEDFYSGWDGTDQRSGKTLPKGAYLYRVKGFDLAGEEIVLSGMINLIR